MLRGLVFGLLCIVALPLMVLGVIVYSVILLLANRPRGISGTTYEPFMGRLMMHAMGTREDNAAWQLADGLPASSPLIRALVISPMVLAARWSGYLPSLLAFPAPKNASILAAMAVRTEFFDRTLLGSLDTVRQVVILGAGWDTRAYGLLRDWPHPVFEVDAPATHGAKLAALKKSGLDASGVTFVAADFNRQSWLEALEENGFDRALPTYLIWEGVTMYLEKAAIDATLESVAGLPGGSAIAFDYFSGELIYAQTPFRMIGKLVTASIKLFYGEPLIFGYTTKPPAREKAAAWMADYGLELWDYEKLGDEEKGRVAPYGFILAGKPENPKPAG